MPHLQPPHLDPTPPTLPRLRVVDENDLRSRSKLVQLCFEDFLEALVRIASMRAPVTADGADSCAGAGAGAGIGAGSAAVCAGAAAVGTPALSTAQYSLAGAYGSVQTVVHDAPPPPPLSIGAPEGVPQDAYQTARVSPESSPPTGVSPKSNPPIERRVTQLVKHLLRVEGASFYNARGPEVTKVDVAAFRKRRTSEKGSANIAQPKVCS